MNLGNPRFVVRWHDGKRECFAAFYHQVNAEMEASYRRRLGFTVRINPL